MRIWESRVMRPNVSYDDGKNDVFFRQKVITKNLQPIDSKACYRIYGCGRG